MEMSSSPKEPSPVNTAGGVGRLIQRFSNSVSHILQYETEHRHLENDFVVSL